MDKSTIKFLLLEGVHTSAVDALTNSGFTEVEYLKTALSEDELVERVKGVHFIGIRSRTQLTERVFDSADSLMAVGCFCIGTNQVDLDAAMMRGVTVFNAPYSNTRSVAELVLAQAIILLRGVAEKNAKAHRGKWLKSALKSYEARGKQLGIVGYGSIGSQLSVMAESLGMKVCFYDVISKLPIGNATQKSTLDELLATSDVVSLHVPETFSTANLISAAQLKKMKQGSILINAARGTVVDIDALCVELESGKLLGAAIDVFPIEPRSNDDEFISPLRKFDNVILTPHIGGSTVEAQENIGVEVVEKLIRYCDNGSTIGSVNFPEVALPSHPDQHRVLHIHNNVPGVLSRINQVFSDHKINISGQYLQTNESVGYVVMDIDAEDSDFAATELQKVPGTIRCRVLF